jgi:membrane protease YdiL (CAAX protease family)
MVIGAIVAMLFIWWVRSISLSDKMNKQINHENTPLNDRMQWRADSACACLVSLVYSSILISSVYVLLNYSWLHSPFGLLVSSVCSYLVFLAVTLKFSRVKTAQSFRQCFGFVIPNLYTCVGALLSGGAIAALAVYLVNRRLLAPHSQLQESFGSMGVGYFDCLLLLAPFWEEVVIRGYLYTAFRQDYSIAASICFMMAIAALSHFSAMFSAPLAFVPLLGVNMILSLFREKTDSIWNCIACHFAYNAVCLYCDNLLS